MSQLKANLMIEIDSLELPPKFLVRCSTKGKLSVKEIWEKFCVA